MKLKFLSLIILNSIITMSFANGELINDDSDDIIEIVTVSSGAS